MKFVGIKVITMKKKKIIVAVIVSLAIYLSLLSILVLVESQTKNSSIKTYFDAVWFSLVTFSTVGYGDIYPISILGKIIGFAFILFSIGFLGVVIGQIANIFNKRSEKRRLGLMGTDFTNHVIIIGWDAFSADVATQLINADKKVAVVTNDKDDIDTINQYFSAKDIFVCFSETNKFAALKLLNIEKASAIFLNNGSDSDKLVSILNIKREYSDIKIVVILDNTELKETFISAGVTYVLSKNEIASKLLASYIFEPAVASFTKELITSTRDEKNYDIQQYRVNENNKYKGSDYGSMFLELKEKYNIIAIGLNKGDKRGLIKAPVNDEKVELGDDVIVIANGITEKVMQNVFKVHEGI